MILLSRYIKKGERTSHCLSVSAQIHRATNSLLGSKELLTLGLEDSARVLSRNYFESLDISVALFVDAEFAAKYSEENLEFGKLWQKEIAYGKVYHYTYKAFEAAGFSVESAESHVKKRKESKNILSASVHCDDSGAFRSMAVPPLGYPGLICDQHHGVISYHTVNHIINLIDETHLFLGIIINCIVSGNFTHIIRYSKSSEEQDSLMSYVSAFQEMVSNHSLECSDSVLADGYVPTEDVLE